MHTTTQQPALNVDKLTFRLSILCPLESGGTVVNQFLVEAAADIAWIRKHADELARTCMPNANYTALNVAAVTCDVEDADQRAMIDRLNQLIAEARLLESYPAFQARLDGSEGAREVARIAALNVEIYQLRNRLKYRFNWVHPELKNSAWMI